MVFTLHDNAQSTFSSDQKFRYYYCYQQFIDNNINYYNILTAALAITIVQKLNFRYFIFSNYFF